MKLIRTEEFIHTKNPNPGKRFMQDILPRDKAPESMGGIFGLIEPGQGPYHFHNTRHSLIMAISGEATEIIEGKEVLLKPYDLLHIPPGEKHMMVNKSNTAFRYLEFYTIPSIDDFVEVK